MAAAGGLLRLTQRIPYHLAMEYALTGRRLETDRLAELGLVNRLTEPGGALDAALELADEVAANAPLAVAATKRIVAESARWSAEEMWGRQGEIAGPALFSEDAREGARAFAERRRPEWKGR